MPSKDKPATPSNPPSGANTSSGWVALIFKMGLWAAGLLAAGLASLLMVVGVAMVMAYPNLPDISDLAEYKPKLPLRVFTADGQLMGEFGEERRNLTPIKDIPKVMKDAVLSIEDNRFYQHGGVD
jgi:penicillin-binding protein 1A